MPTHERPIEQIKYSLDQEINELYWSIALRNFAVALIGIYTPIYVYLYFDKSIPVMFMFYGLQFLGQALLVPLTARLMKFLGLKKMMAIGSPFLGIYLIFLLLAENYGITMMGLAILTKLLYLTIYWPARHTDFARFAKDKKRGRQLSMASIIVALAKTAAPFIGGIVIMKIGFTPLFIGSAILMSLAAIPLFFSKEVYEKYSYKYLESYRTMINKRNLRTSLVFFFEGIEFSMSIFLFTIFIYQIIGKLDTIGWITSLSLFFTLLFTYVIGWLSDRKGSKQIIAYASIVHAFTWLINAFIKTPIQFLIYSSFFRLAETANHLPFISLYYKHAKDRGKGIDEYIVFHEIAHNLGRVFMFLIVIIGFSAGFSSYLFYFSIAALASLSIRFIK